MTLNRRDLLVKTGSAILLSLFSTTNVLAYRKVFNASDSPAIIDPNEPSFEAFYRLSQWLTYRESLSRDAAQRMFTVFQDEPWGKQHISRVYSKLQLAIKQEKEKTDISKLIGDQYFDSGESWFISHLIYTWYVGIYYHEARPAQRVIYEESLMFDSAGDWLPVPFVDRTPYGEWQQPPEAAI